MTTASFAGTGKLGDPFSMLPLAEKTVSPYFISAGVLSINSIPRSKITASGNGECNPVAWQYTLAPKNSEKLDVTATVTVYEEAYADFENGEMKTKCVPSTHFTIEDKYPMDTPTMDLAKLKNAVPLDTAADLAKANGMAEITLIDIRQTMGIGEPSFIQYSFYGKTADGKKLGLGINSETSSIEK
jgi:hypothetical protein